jgi:hypothetical protein
MREFARGQVEPSPSGEIELLAAAPAAAAAMFDVRFARGGQSYRWRWISLLWTE